MFLTSFEMDKESYALDTFLRDSIKPKSPNNKEFYHDQYFKYQEWCSEHEIPNVDEKRFEARLKLHLEALNHSNPKYISTRKDVQLKNEIAERIVNKLREHGMKVETLIQPYPYFPEFDVPKVLKFNPSGEMWEYFKRPHKAKSWYKPFKMISVPALALHYFRDIFTYIDERWGMIKPSKHINEYYLYTYRLIDNSFSDKLIAELRETLPHERQNELNKYVEEQSINGVKMWNEIEDEEDEKIHGNQEFWSNIETTPEERFYGNLTWEHHDEPRLIREMYYFYPECV